MPAKKTDEGKRSGIASGLFVRSNPLLITDEHCSETLNFNFDTLSAEEAFGLRRIGARRPQTAGVRYRPVVKRTSVAQMTRWRDGYNFAPVHPLTSTEPLTIEGHIRLEEVTSYPESGVLNVPKTYGGLTGRYLNTVGTQRNGGEHQFFPMVSRGAREVERPHWTLGVGVVRPQGLKSATVTDDSDADSIRPVFAWWDPTQQRLRVAAANINIEAGLDYHIAVVFEAAVSKWYVNGTLVSGLTGFGLQSLPLSGDTFITQPSLLPIYMGRCYTREPGIFYTTQHDKKHAYMGKFGCVVDAVGGANIGIFGEQLAFAAATASSYVGYRMRVQQGAGGGVTGRIFNITVIANQNNDATITFTVNAAGHGIAVNDIVDIIPMCEPLAVDATVQEIRLWKVSLDATTVSRLAKMRALSDIRKGTNTEDVHPLMMPDWGARTPRHLIAYWPMDEGGGNVCRDLIGQADAYFAPSGVSLTDQNIGSSSSRAFFMDGETQSVQVDLSEDPNCRLNWPWNLGRNAGTENHWNVCFRMQFFVGGSMEFTNAGSIQNHLYQTLCSLGSRSGGTPVLEARLTNFGGTGLQIYFRMPDGTISTIPVTLTPGRWYNAIIGVEAPPYFGSGSAENARTHRAYFRYLDADLAPAGDFSAAFLMKRVMADAGVDFVLAFGASVRGTPTQGVGDNNHAIIGVSCLGVGHHPAHQLTFGVAPTLLLPEINPLISFSEINDAEGCAPLITGQDGGCNLTQGSRTVTVASSEPLPGYLRRFPIKIAHAILEIIKKGEAVQTVPNSLVIQAVSGFTASLFTAHIGPNIKGAELRAQVWAIYTNLTTVEPGFDTDLNAGVDTGSSWALTKDVFSNIAGGALHFYIAIDPTYDYVSPLRIFPSWDVGIVDRMDNRVECLRQYKTSEGKATILAVGNGCLYDVDERWRKGGPFSVNDFSWQFRYRPFSDRRERMRRRDESSILTRANMAYRMEAIKWTSAFNFDGGQAFACLEADVWLDTLEGRQTISACVNKVYQTFGGSAQMGWSKNHHFYIRDGDVVFEMGDEAAGTFLKARTTGNCTLNVGEWIRLQVEIQGDQGVPNIVVGVVIRVNGRAVATTVTTSGGGFDSGMLPGSTDGSSYLGACGNPQFVAFVDPLRGKIGGFAYRISDDGYSYQGQDYDVTRVDTEPGLFVLAFLEGAGLIFEFQGNIIAMFIGEVALPVGAGMGQLPDQESSITVFGDVAYINTGFTRPWRYDFEEFTPAGLRSPVGRLTSVLPVRIPLRVQDQGADVPALIGRANTVQIQLAAPQLLGFAGSVPTVAEGDVGALVYVPSDPAMGAAAEYPCGYIGVVTAIVPATPGYTVTPGPFASHVVAVSSWMLFRAAKLLGTIGAASYKAAVGRLQSTTPWGARRLICDGKDNNSAPQTEALVEGPTLPGCLHFRGNIYFESGPYQSTSLPLTQGKVVSAKGYIKLDTPVATGDEMVIWEMAKDGDSGCFRISLFDGGRLKFEFFDTLLGAFRSIRTTAKVISPNQWFYLHFRYKFKQAGSSVLDTVGGWEPDLRWLRKAVGAPALWKSNNFRDMLLIYACEGLHETNPTGRMVDASVGYFGDVDEGAPCAMLQLPGCQSQIGGAIAAGAQATFNNSQHLLNVGILKDAPYLTPEPGDALFPLAGVLATSPKSGINVITQVGATAGKMSGVGPLFNGAVQDVGGDTTPGNASPSGFVSQFQFPAGYVLPRTCSMNRDDAWNRKAEAGNINLSTQIAETATLENFFHATQVTATNLVGNTQNLASYAVLGAGSSYSKQDCWAVLLRVWSKTADGAAPVGVVGNPPDVIAGEVCRTFAIVHVGINDIGEPNVGGVAGGAYRVFVTDDVLYGGDGGGTLKIGGLVAEAGSNWHATIELMNGLNQARVSANRLVWPSLLEHGENPVGKSDSPDQSQCALRLGGTTQQGEDGVSRRGFRGHMADVGFLFAALNPSIGNVYTTDCMAPDAFFNGPNDTRFQSLPRLNFGTNALILDDPSGAPATIASAVYRCSELSGNKLAPDPAFSAQDAPTLFAVSDKIRTLSAQGIHKFWTTYFDRKQLVESNPSLEFMVNVEGEDGSGDFLLSEIQFNLVGVPISGDRREYLSRRVYKSMPGGSIPFLLAQVDDDSTAQFFPRLDERALPFQAQAAFDNGRPPRCKAIFATEENVVYVGLDDAPNVVNISKAFKPEHVPGTKILFAESGRGGGVIGANLTRGLLLISKRNALFVVNTAGANFKTSRVGHSVGTLSHNSIADCDGVLYFLAQKGVFTFAGNQVAYEASEYIDVLYQSLLDPRGMWRSAAAHLVDRSQFLAIVKRLSDFEPRLLLHGEQRFDEFGNREYTWGLIDFGIPFTAMAEFEDIEQEAGRVVVATATGLIAEYNSGSGIGLSPGPHFSFASIVQNTSSATGKLIVGTAFLDLQVDGIYDNLPVMVVSELDALGAPVSVGAVDFTVVARDEIVFARNVTGLAATFYTRRQTNWLSLAGRTAYVGAYEWAIRSKWFDALVGEDTKAWDFLDLYFDVVVGGVAYLEVYVDFRTTNPWRYRIEMDRGFFSIPITTLYSRHLQFRIKGFTKASRLGFALHRYNLRGRPQEWGMRQKT